MTKDELIAGQRQEIDRLLGVIERLTTKGDRSSAAVRQERYRDRHKLRNGDASRVTSRGDTGGLTPLTPSTASLPGTDQEDVGDDGVVKGARDVTVTRFANSEFTVTQELLEWAQGNLKPSLTMLELRNATLEFSEYWRDQSRLRSLQGWDRTWKNCMIKASGRKMSQAS